MFILFTKCQRLIEAAKDMNSCTKTNLDGHLRTLKDSLYDYRIASQTDVKEIKSHVHDVKSSVNNLTWCQKEADFKRPGRDVLESLQKVSRLLRTDIIPVTESDGEASKGSGLSK